MATTNKIYWTLLDLVTKVREDLDLQEEIFIKPTEMIGYINEAIDTAESAVMGLYEDYFLTRAELSLVSGQELYLLPVDIYAHKIRRMVYSKGPTVYKIHRMRDWKKFENYALDKYTSSGYVQAYFLVNSTPGAPQILFSPTPTIAADAAVTIWYTRQANRVEFDPDILDIPEAYKFIVSYTKQKCMMKEQHPGYNEQKNTTKEEKQDMLSTLATMIPDADNEIEPDYSSYQEHS